MSAEEQLESAHLEQIPLRVTSGILLHIGAGIYNTVAGAIKELVSNSFDADATRVLISTGYPRFEQIKVVDNGAGMTADYFKRAMASIGSTLKGTVLPDRLTPGWQRPMIGQLGIGLMALTQVCDHATIESQVPGSDRIFVAKLDFSQFRERKQKQLEAVKLDILRESRLQSQEVKDASVAAQLELAAAAGEAFDRLGEADPEGEHLGYCALYHPLGGVRGEHGTTITLTKIDEGVKAALTDRGRSRDAMPKYYRETSMDWNQFRDVVNEWPWRDLCERLRLRTGGLTYQSLPQYHQFLWELSIMTPVQYHEGWLVTLEPDLLSQKRKQIDSFNFSVMVDNRILRKPALLPSGDVARKGKLERGYDYYVQTVTEEKPVDGDDLRYEGYLFWQRKQIEPSALRGIQIYIRNVGIGVYDQTLMGFSLVNPASRAGQISGELYVEEGLERALNVDRNSFRQTDAHYVAVQEHLWKALGSATRGDGVMGMSVDAYWARKKRAEERARKQHVRDLRELVGTASGGALGLHFSDSDSPQPYSVGRRTLTVFDGSRRWPRSGAERRLCQRVVISAAAAVATGCPPADLLAFLEDILLTK